MFQLNSAFNSRKSRRAAVVFFALAGIVIALIGVRLWFIDGLLRKITIDGPSMAPALAPADRVVIDRWPLMFREPKRGEVLAIQVPDSTDFAVKRVAFLPGEHPTIRQGDLYDGERKLPLLPNKSQEQYLDPYGLQRDWQFDHPLDANEYFLLGDNQPVSIDSRHFGPIPRSQILGLIRKR